MVPIVAIVGKSGSGKTVLMEKLIAEFKSRGYRVAAVKHAHTPVELDLPGKDTFRFAQAGCDAAVVCSPTRITVFKGAGKEPSPEEAAAALGEGYDLLLAEGFKSSRVPRLEVCGDAPAGMICREGELAAVISDSELAVKIPRFRRDAIIEIANFIDDHILSKVPADMNLEVNGNRVFLKRFVKDIMASSILAMVNTLKTVGVIRHLSIIIRTGNR